MGRVGTDLGFKTALQDVLMEMIKGMNGKIAVWDSGLGQGVSTRERETGIIKKRTWDSRWVESVASDYAVKVRSVVSVANGSYAGQNQTEELVAVVTGVFRRICENVWDAAFEKFEAERRA